MRHGKKFNHLSRPAAHRKALLTNLAKELILHKRIRTTLAKAKELRKFIEPILTKAKKDTTHARRVVFSYFQDKVPVKELFDDVASQISDRPGGYTRIIRLGNRLGDHAEMCMIELVDYNKLFHKEDKPMSAKTGTSKSNVVVHQEKAHTSTNESAVAVSTQEVSEEQGNPTQVAEPTSLGMRDQNRNTSEVSEQETTDVTTDN